MRRDRTTAHDRMRTPRRAMRRAAAAALAAGAVAGLLAATTPAEAKDTTAPAPRPVVTGWLPYWAADSATATVTSHADLFREASPFFFSTTASAVTLQGSASSLQSMVAALHAQHITVIPTFTTTMNADQFAAVLKDPAKLRAHVRMLVQTAATYGTDGVDLDYENINFGSSAARDVVRVKYPALLHRLDTALGQRGMVSSVTVPARRSDTDPNWWVYDYGALAPYADRFRIMTYDYSWSGGAAGPVSPKSWVDQVLAYAVTRVPPSHLSFGMPSYGYDWYAGAVKGSCGSAARATVSRTSSQMAQLAASRGITPSWDAAGTSRTFTYRAHYGTSCVARRVAYYDDSRSFRAKLPLVAKYHLRGVAIWALGNETSAMWHRMHGFGMRVAVRSTTVQAHTPGRVVYGTATRARGTVLVGGTPRAGVPVTLVRRPLGATRWTKVAVVQSAADGTVTFPITPRSHMQYQMRSPRDWAYTSGRSDVTTTRVSYRVALDSPRGRAVATSSSVSVSGQVSPDVAGVSVRKQFLRDGHWVNVGGVTRVDAHGRFVVTVHAHHPMTRTVRLVATSGPLDVGTSSAIKLRFR